ncbi:MAG TPA: hypothetical protein PLL69_06260 [Gemmatimonadales bacterium]|nr:hypothetical protein [Gemmatimonadales bacterium]
MSDGHLDMEGLLAVRDADRSDPDSAAAHRHLAGCRHCQLALDRLHQRTARLRALPMLEPGRSQYPMVRSRVALERRVTWYRRTAKVALATAAAVAIAVVGSDLVRPAQLDAAEQLESAMTRSEVLERTLQEYRPDTRAIDARTAQVVIELEDRIADVDARLSRTAAMEHNRRLDQQVALWQERVGLMSALVDVHLTKATNVGL